MILINMEKHYEYWIDWKCKHWLSVSVNSCRKCLFEALCHLEQDKEKREKSDLD